MNELNQESPSLGRFQAPYFFFSCDQDHKFTYVSPSVETVLGFQPSTVLGKTYRDFVDEDDTLYHVSARADQVVARQAESDYLESIQASKRSDGTTAILRIASYTEFDSAEGQNDLRQSMVDRQPVAYHSIAQDVTDVYQIDQLLIKRLGGLLDRTIELSQREQDVLDRVLNGRLNKSIAKELDITERGIERVRSRLMTKFQAETSAELVRKATVQNLLNDLLSLIGDGSPIDLPASRQHFFRSLLRSTATVGTEV